MNIRRVSEEYAEPIAAPVDKPETLGRVGIITNRFDTEYYGYMVESASAYLITRGFQTVVQSNLSYRQGRGQLEAYLSLAEIDCDGLIIHADSLSDNELNTLFEQHTNAVLLNRLIDRYPSRCVYTNNVDGGAKAARYLLEQGHEKIGMVTGPSLLKEVKDRTAGFEIELRRSGIELLMKAEGNFSLHSGTRAMESMLDAEPGLTAVFFHNDEMAFGGLNACRQRGVKVPQEVSMIGYDGRAMCDYVSPKLTSIQQPLRQIGEHAAEIVCDLISNSKDSATEHNAICYDTVLSERESVGPPPGYKHNAVVLTDREVECLTWTARGKTAWEISVILGLSESTTTFHLRNAGTKLKANNRTHAVVLSMLAGLIEP